MSKAWENPNKKVLLLFSSLKLQMVVCYLWVGGLLYLGHVQVL